MGGSTDPSGKLNVGYVILSRKSGSDSDGVSVSEWKSEWFHRKITCEFTKKICENDDDAQWKSGSNIQPDFISQIFVDNEQILLNYFKRKESEDLDNSMGHDIVKIAAAATENNQPLDAGKCFPTLISNVKQNTMNSNVNGPMLEWDKIVKQLQDEGQLVLNLSNTSTCSSVSSLSTKMKTICDIIGIIPESYQKALTTNNVRKSFVKTGYISTIG